jgi:hypothetical protein
MTKNKAAGDFLTIFPAAFSILDFRLPISDLIQNPKSKTDYPTIVAVSVSLHGPFSPSFSCSAIHKVQPPFFCCQMVVSGRQWSSMVAYGRPKCVSGRHRSPVKRAMSLEP